jgi:hypothetical protein
MGVNMLFIMAHFITVKQDTGIDPAIVATVAGRMQMGRSCSDLVTSGQITQGKLEEVRRAVVDHWSDAQYTADPSYHVTKELAYLESVADCAAHIFQITTGYDPSGQTVGGVVAAPSLVSESIDQDDSSSREDMRQTEPSAPAAIKSASPHHYLKLMLDTSKERRKLLGINAPERREVIHRERPAELLASYFDDIADVTPDDEALTQ